MGGSQPPSPCVETCQCDADCEEGEACRDVASTKDMPFGLCLSGIYTGDGTPRARCPGPNQCSGMQPGIDKGGCTNGTFCHFSNLKEQPPSDCKKVCTVRFVLFLRVARILLLNVQCSALNNATVTIFTVPMLLPPNKRTMVFACRKMKATKSTPNAPM